MRSLLGRSVIAAVAGILIALVVVGAAIDVLAARDLRQSLDRQLRARAVEVAQLSASAPALLTTPGALDSPLGGAETNVEVLDRHGRLVARSLGLGGRLLPARNAATRAIATGRPSYASADFGGDRLRLYTAPLAAFGGAAAGGAVVVAASERATDRLLGRLHVFVLVAGIAGAVLAAAGVYLLLRRALRPVARLAVAAAEVERTGDPRRQLPVPATGDEVGQLAVTLNAMLASLARSRDLERRFLADASHELRTPLTALRGNVSYIAEHGLDPDAIRDLEADAERLARLADDLLALSREESASPTANPVRLDVLARDVAARHERTVLVRSDPVTVLGDEHAIRRALDNLLENARRHGPPSGRISVMVEDTGEAARISVVDEGPGLLPQEASLAFQRFWRRGAAAGSGLGLAIVRATAERHGGSVSVEGARFTIELPVFRNSSASVGTTRADPKEKGFP